MLAYSAIKTTANLFLEYSVLNPETSSLSPSEKSKGVRLVSAIIIINQINNILGNKINLSKGLIFSESLITLKSIKIIEITRAKLTSYEIVCATFRIAPNPENLLLEDHPANKTG